MRFLTACCASWLQAVSVRAHHEGACHRIRFQPLTHCRVAQGTASACPVCARPDRQKFSIEIRLPAQVYPGFLRQQSTDDAEEVTRIGRAVMARGRLGSWLAGQNAKHQIIAGRCSEDQHELGPQRAVGGIGIELRMPVDGAGMHGHEFSARSPARPSSPRNPPRLREWHRDADHHRRRQAHTEPADACHGRCPRSWPRDFSRHGSR